MQKFLYQRWMVLCALVLAVPINVWAHAFLDHAEPGVGSEVHGTPAVVKIWFTQNLEPAFSVIELQDAQGRQIDKKDSYVDPQNKSLLLVSLPELRPGTYTVIWHVVSVDTHKTEGKFKFTVK
jgi:methionine-rich copper-binding protein CopC